MEPGAVCVDDPTSDHYNRVLTGDGLPPPAERDWAGAEAMRRDLAHGDDLYQWGIVVRYNGIEVEDGSGDPGPGAGSCIFLHIWRGPERPTVGCTAMARADLLTVLRWLTADARPVLIQGDRAWLEELRREGTLFYPVPGAGALSTMMKSPVPAGTRMDGGSEGPRTACSCPVPAGTGMGERPAACPS
jgi:D-alanyl-D-alanine dipeptidase